jgi:heme A synthase
MVPEMSGGVFWEHLHRLVAGGLLLMWGLASWFARKETRDRPWIFKAATGGIALLLVQSVFGGLTVLFRLPDLISTTHLSLALLFLCLATVLASATSWAGRMGSVSPGAGGSLARWASGAAGLVFLQSVLGGLVRHTDAGMACPDAPLCMGQWVPALTNSLVTLHYAHRVLGIAVAVAVITLALRTRRVAAPPAVRGWADGAAALVLVQVGLGFLSVLTGLAVVPVSLHTLVAASLLVVLVHLATAGTAAARVAPGSGASTAPVG